MSKRWPPAFLVSGLIFVIVASSLTYSCVPVLSSRKTTSTSLDHKVSGGLIKPKLQDQTPNNSHRSTADINNKGNSSDQIRRTSEDSGWSRWSSLVSIFSSAKSSSRNSDSSSLIKPKLSDDVGVGVDDAKKPGRSFQAAAPREEMERQGSASKSNEGLDSELDSKHLQGAKPKKSENVKPSVDVKPKSETRETASNESKIDASREGNAKRDEAQSDGQEAQTTFKKHDHARYVTMIRNKAIDTLNKEPGCDIARLCRDSFTDDWSLTLYVKSGKYYSYTVYTWDEIEGNWVASYTSEKRPVGNMKKHLGFSSAGKTCQTLKGSEHAESF